MTHHDPYPEEESDDYEWTSEASDFTYPARGDARRGRVKAGDTVALPERIARHITDKLRPAGADDAEPAQEDEEPAADDDEAAGPPPIPDDDEEAFWGDYQAMRSVAKEYEDVNGRLGKDELAAELRAARDEA